MILLSFTQAQVDLCQMRCFLKCLSEKNPKPNCISDCESRCEGLISDTSYKCNVGCKLMKSIAINIGMYSLKIFTYFHGFLIFLYIRFH